jgi:hypothetical protein
MEYNIYVHACVIILKHKIKELHAMKDRRIQGNNVAKYWINQITLALISSFLT